MRLEVQIKHLVWIFAIVAQALQHLVGTEVRQGWIVDLYIPQPLIVQHPELLPIRRGKISESMAGAETGRDKLRALLGLYAGSSHGESGRRGCLVVGSANEISTFDAEAAKRIEDAYTSNEEFILDLIVIGQADGSISPSVDPAAVAISLLCVMNGMRIVGKTGSTAAEMNAVAETAMKLLT